ncbi:hypothetical protein L2E82_45939 [Cichorium intybus]|uniref:Uncharacterized protein n=1 Tax=Cichorium intybus TaxID=13427 RepID=A0ACB8ZU87_CICIN|nr:hypothetical protein L2E82_45939 [Cichorium intybus]
MDASQWKLEAVNNNNIQVEERKVRPQEQQQPPVGPLNCPRCKSTNTKFCYYNNYSLTQPRYLCKGCRRYWTQGGSLRNVPVGGGSRKNKRSISSSSITTQNATQHLNLSFQQQDYHHQNGFSQFLKPPKIENNPNDLNLFGSNSNPMFNIQVDENRTKYGGFQELMLPFGVMMNQQQLPSTREEGGSQNIGGSTGYWSSNYLGGD